MRTAGWVPKHCRLIRGPEFPVSCLRIKELSPRDGFAADCRHRQPVCVSGVRRAGARVSREIPAVSRGLDTQLSPLALMERVS